MWCGPGAGPGPWQGSGSQAQHLPIGTVGDHINPAIRCLAHIADALRQVDQLALLTRHGLSTDSQSNQGLSAQSPRQQLARPARITVTLDEAQAAGRDGQRCPPLEWLLETGHRPVLANTGSSTVVAAIGHSWPAIVAPRLDSIDLIAALRAMFRGPQLARLGMHCQALDVAVTQAPDLGPGSWTTNKRVVGRCLSLAGDANDLADVVAKVLCLVFFGVAIAQTDVQMSIAIERDAGKTFYGQLAYVVRGLASLYSGAPDKAQADLKRAVELNPKEPFFALFLHLAERRTGSASSLASSVSNLDMTRWPAPVIRMFLHEGTPGDVLVVKGGPVTICEAVYFTAEFMQLESRKDEALSLYRRAVSDCPRHILEGVTARAALRSLGVTP